MKMKVILMCLLFHTSLLLLHYHRQAAILDYTRIHSLSLVEIVGCWMVRYDPAQHPTVLTKGVRIMDTFNLVLICFMVSLILYLLSFLCYKILGAEIVELLIDLIGAEKKADSHFKAEVVFVGRYYETRARREKDWDGDGIGYGGEEWVRGEGG